MSSTINPRKLWRRVITSVVASMIILGTIALAEFTEYPYFVSWLVALFVVVSLFEWGKISNSISKNESWVAALSLISIGMLFFVSQVYFQFGVEYLLLLLFMVVGFDTGAYFSGKLFGKHALAPDLSPGKTWEGFTGGFVAATVVSYIAHLYGVIPFQIVFYLPVAVSIFAQCGDLFESWFKRVANKKDSGDILPGHGGALDRIDGMLFAAPVFYLFILLFV